MIRDVSEAVKYIGADDPDLDLFESQYKVPDGMCYNSYVILDEKIAVLDTIDRRKTDEWFENLEKVLDGRKPDYLVISHLEPDHAYNIAKAAEKYPDMKLIGNAKTFNMLPQFFDLDTTDRTVVVKEGETVDLGAHKLTFYMAPMVHWPEVMVSFEETEGILFSADGFGKFGVIDAEPDDWACEARRYYFNIVGKYGAQVQALLKKAAKLDIKAICPLHGPVLTENLGYYINLYDIWSKYEPETDGIFIAYASIHGNTKEAALKLYEILKAKTDLPIAISDLTREDLHEAVEDAFRYSRMVILAPTYDGGIFPIANDFLHHLKIKTYRNRKVAIVENGSWAPAAGKIIREYFESMKGIEISDVSVTIKSSVKPETVAQLEALADSIL
ncbi:MAG: FprA family A-type flavoprotein [Clostridia bacterium]|nr:FprA family A-type flavoprotein [Clostridia bacterium]